MCIAPLIVGTSLESGIKQSQVIEAEEDFHVCAIREGPDGVTVFCFSK